MISFIIPTYNRVHTIGKSIESILKQTCSEWELIIVDDGSQDETKKYIETYLRDARINYTYQTNQGVAVARNHGANLAKGEYLIFLDSDDIVEISLVQTLLEYSYMDYDLISWQLNKIIDSKSEIVKPKNLGYIYNYRTAIFLAGGVCYKKNIFLKVGGYDHHLTFGENYELGLRICQLKNLNVLILNKILGSYIIEKSKRISNSISNRLYSLVYYYKKHRKLYDSNREECSKINYQLGYLLENANKINYAIIFYKKSWKISHWKIKPFLKFNYLKLKKTSKFSFSNKRLLQCNG